MNTKFEVINYLNMINPRLGQYHKLTGYNPLPDDFILDDDKIKERLYIAQLRENVSVPEFIRLDKKSVKKYFKNSEKNINKLQKLIPKVEGFDKDFKAKLEFYLNVRTKVTDLILKDFSNQRFDEREAYKEIYDINPIWGKLLASLFEDNVDFDSLLQNLEEKYQLSYLEKIQILEKKNKVETPIKHPVSTISQTRAKKSKLSLSKKDSKLADIEKKIAKNTKTTNKKIDKEL